MSVTYEYTTAWATGNRVIPDAFLKLVSANYPVVD